MKRTPTELANKHQSNKSMVKIILDKFKSSSASQSASFLCFSEECCTNFKTIFKINSTEKRYRGNLKKKGITFMVFKGMSTVASRL